MRHHPYRVIVLEVSCGWLIASIGLTIVSVASPVAISHAMLPVNELWLLGVASLGIAFVSMMPGWFIDIPSDESDSPAPMERIGNAFLIGMMIRLFGTVALFLASSYYMEAAATKLATIILSWHLFLLAVETVLLSRVMTRD